MSLVPTYVQADNGLFYKDPIIAGPDWYICYDDNDPPELVIMKDSPLTANDVLKKLEELEYELIVSGKGHNGYRLFPHDNWKSGFFPARAYFLEHISGAMPHSKIVESKGKPKKAVKYKEPDSYEPEDSGDCVFYPAIRK